MSILSERLKEARKRKGKLDGRKLTQIMVQDATGVHSSTLGGYENSVSEPDSETLLTLANYYGVTTDWLLGNTSNPAGHLTEEQLEAVKKVNMDDDSFLDVPFIFNGRELTREQKIKLRSAAQLFLE